MSNKIHSSNDYHAPGSPESEIEHLKERLSALEQRFDKTEKSLERVVDCVDNSVKIFGSSRPNPPLVTNADPGDEHLKIVGRRFDKDGQLICDKSSNSPLGAGRIDAGHDTYDLPRNRRQARVEESQPGKDDSEGEQERRRMWVSNAQLAPGEGLKDHVTAERHKDDVLGLGWWLSPNPSNGRQLDLYVNGRILRGYHVNDRTPELYKKALALQAENDQLRVALNDRETQVRQWQAECDDLLAEKAAGWEQASEKGQIR